MQVIGWVWVIFWGFVFLAPIATEGGSGKIDPVVSAGFIPGMLIIAAGVRNTKVKIGMAIATAAVLFLTVATVVIPNLSRI